MADAALPRGLLVDDDPALRQEVCQALGRFGLAMQAVADGAAMRAALARHRFDLILLDLALPGEDGHALLRWLRGQPDPLRQTPVLMLSAHGDVISRVLGLELGADDYLAKPFEPRELLARLKALLRRASGAHGTSDAALAMRLRFSGWRFDRAARALWSPQGVMVALSGAEFRLLQAFVAYPRLALSRERLLSLSGSDGSDCSVRSIDLGVSRLRAKLGDGTDGQALIHTVRGQGYLLAADVRPD